MKHVIVRIEDPDGYGPYRADVDWGWDTPHASRHPTPYEDCGLRSTWSDLNALKEHELWSFGFRHAKQMRSWFDDAEWLFAMRKAGLRLTIWEVDAGDVHFGESQIIFRRDKATLVSEEELISDERYFLWLAADVEIESVVPA